MYSCVASSSRDGPTRHCIKTDTQIRDLTKKGESTAKDCKVLTQDVKFTSNVSGDMEAIADLGHFNGTVGGSETLDMQWK